MPTLASFDEIMTRPKILFFGGSLDPVHIGHTTLPFDAVARLWGESGWGVVYVPAAQSPHKEKAPTEDKHRIAMLQIGLGSRADAAIWMHELTNKRGPSYWADTWEHVRIGYPEVQSRFLIGTDQALMMHRWSRYKAFWRDAVVVLRESDSEDDLIVKLHEIGKWSLEDLDTWSSMVVSTDLVDASSTRIRDALADEDQRTARIEGLDPGVQEYILEHNLYRAD
jgi:nicotinate-nucleotide adenylyltransferase